MRTLTAALPGVNVDWSPQMLNNHASLPTSFVQEVRPKIRMGVTGQVDVRKPDTRPKLVSLGAAEFPHQPVFALAGCFAGPPYSSSDA